MCSKPIYHGPRVKDLETFIQKAQFVHGDTYGYDKAEYVNSRSKITITCPVHGDFNQQPDNHLSGKGCPKCRDDSKRSNTEEFTQKAKSVHGDKYSYEKAEYLGSKSKLTITCPIHGDFEQSPSHHLGGDGCSECRYDSLKSTTDQFIEQAKLVHDEKYSYVKAEYLGSQSKITITCPIHGDFQQKPTHHLGGQGCASCKFDSKRSNTEEFVRNAQFVHDSKYSYEKAEYVGSKSKITITCPIHGDFKQSPDSHLSGNGCPSCKNESLPGGYRDNKEEYKQTPAIFYHVKFTDKNTDEAFEKFGITVKSVERRFSQITKHHNLKLEVIDEYPTTLYEAIELEQDIKQHLLDNNLAYRVHTLKQYNINGWTECFRCGDLDGILDTSCFS